MKQTADESEMIGVLRRILDAGQLAAVFQPIVDLRKGEPAGFEALTRLTEAAPLRTPDELFTAAETCGELWRVEQATRQTTFAAAEDWPTDCLLFVNATPAVVADRRFADRLAAEVARVPGLAPGRIVIEITEKSDQQTTPALVHQAEQLRAHGFQIAIDDVGAGTSGLNRIMLLKPHWLKLDRELVDHIDRDRAKRNLIRFLQHFARLTGVRIIAEGIERREELDILADLGIPFGQGYLLARPGARGQVVDPETAGWLRDRWVRAAGERHRHPRDRRVAPLIREACVINGQELTTDVASRLVRTVGVAGVVIEQGQQAAAWVDRDRLMRAASDGRAGLPVAVLAGRGADVIDADVTIAEAIEIAASRHQSNAASPLVASDAGGVRGVVLMQDLLAAAAELIGRTDRHTVPLTGLPDRVSCEEHLAGLLRGRPDDPSVDVAFVDVRNLAVYNGALGYELGDHLILQLAGVLGAVLAREDSGVFLGHLGDDRFIVTGPSGWIERRLVRVIDRFEQGLWADAGLDMQVSEQLNQVGVRAVVMIGANHRFGALSELLSANSRLRRVEPEAGRSITVFDRPEVLRKTA